MIYLRQKIKVDYWIVVPWLSLLIGFIVAGCLTKPAEPLLPTATPRPTFTPVATSTPVICPTAEPCPDFNMKWEDRKVEPSGLLDPGGQYLVDIKIVEIVEKADWGGCLFLGDTGFGTVGFAYSHGCLKEGYKYRVRVVYDGIVNLGPRGRTNSFFVVQAKELICGEPVVPGELFRDTTDCG